MKKGCVPKVVGKIRVFLGTLFHQGRIFWGVMLEDKTTSLRLMRRQNRWNRENTVRILTLPQNEDFRLRSRS